MADLTTIIPSKDPEATNKIKEKYAQEADRYRDQQAEIQSEARQKEQEVETERKRADRFDLAEVFLEIALVITSITLLSGRRTFWYAGMVLAVVGVATAITGLVVR